MINVNLVPDARLAKKRRRVRLRVWTALCLAYALVLVAMSAGGYVIWSGGDVALANELEAVGEQAKDYQFSIDTLQQELAEAEAALQASRAMGNQPDWSTLLVLLAQKLGDEIVLDGCKLSPLAEQEDPSGAKTASPKLSAKDIPLGQRRYCLKLSGFGRTQTAVSQFVLRLEQIPLFEEVKLVKSNRQDFLSSEAVGFEIECSI